jgi:hypothetical protein
MAAAPSPRVLRLTFDLQVPAGLRRNIHWPRIETAVSTFIGVMQGVATNAFPWATSMKVRKEWMYLYHDSDQQVELASTDVNTGPFTTSGDENAPIIDE